MEDNMEEEKIKEALIEIPVAILEQRKEEGEEYVRIKSILEYDLDRYPELKDFSEDELKKLMTHWDNIFARWLRRFYLNFGVEVVHEPEDEYPIRFVRFQKGEIKSLKLGQVKFDVQEVPRDKEMVEWYLDKRLKELKEVTEEYRRKKEY